MDTFKANMEAQRERARKASATDADAWSNVDVWTSLSDEHDATDFQGYDVDVLDGVEVISIVANGESVLSASAPAKVEVVLDHTPFYAEMGGQVGDTGTIAGENFKIRVNDTKTHDGLVAHVGEIVDGTVSVADLAKASIDVQRRNLIRRNHTATHLLDAALKKVLGDHVHQAGSLVAPTHLRFDFTHFEAVTKPQLAEIERIVNGEILAATPVVTHVMGIDEAKQAGAVALFGEKYGDVVRVVSTGDDISGAFSAELCGGTHAHNTAEIGFFKIVSEGSVGAAVRRIEAVTSAGALAYVNERLDALDSAAAALKCRPLEVGGRIDDALKKERELKQRLQQAMTGGASGAIAKAISGVFEVDGYKCVVARFSDMEAKELRSVWDTIREQIPAPVACVLGSKTPEGKVALLAAGTKDAVALGFDANSIIKQIAGFVGGRGGGKPDMAQAGGKDVAGLEQAVESARKILS
jgi:alanyl-tRNA synthetase